MSKAKMRFMDTPPFIDAFIITSICALSNKKSTEERDEKLVHTITALAAANKFDSNRSTLKKEYEIKVEFRELQHT